MRDCLLKDLSRRMPLFLLVIGSCLSIAIPSHAQTNLGFESGLKGWTLKGESGHVSVDKHHAYLGKACARIAGYGGLAMRMNATPLSIVQFNLYISSERAGVIIYPFIRFYDSSDALLLEYKSRILSYTTWQSTGNYTETPAGVSWMEIGIETDISATSASEIVYTDNFSIVSDPGNSSNHGGSPAVKNHPTCDIGQYLRPFWLSDTIYDETVLLYAPRRQAASGRLLYTPDKILSVKSFDGKTSYSPQTDFSLENNVITRSGNSPIPFKADTFFNTKNNFAWYNLQSQWIIVTYTHQDNWEGPTPEYKGDKMPNTLAKLRAGSPVNVVAYGSSITRGMAGSGYSNTPPYMPSYMELFVDRLEKLYSDKAINLSNASLPGSLVSWGAENADKYINPLKPDLVILDFGVNDCWSYTPDDYKDYIATIIRKVKADNPQAEFLLISNMMFDPDYVLDGNDKKKWWLSNIRGYNNVLQSLETKGIADLDMTTLSQTIYQRKKAKDCLTNPIYPNDYLARWYAQAMAALFDERKP